MNPVVFNLKNKLSWLSSSLRWLNDDDKILMRLDTMNAVNTLLEKTMNNPLLFTMKIKGAKDTSWKKHSSHRTSLIQPKIQTEKSKISNRWPLRGSSEQKVSLQPNKRRRSIIKPKRVQVKVEGAVKVNRRVAMSNILQETDKEEEKRR